MLRRAAAVTMAVLAAGCSEPGTAPEPDLGARLEYGTQASSYVDLGHVPPVARARAGGPKAGSSLANGSFEANDGNTSLTDWGTWSVGDGSWLAQSGTESPISFFTVPPPPDGEWAAMTDQSGPGSHILYQDVTVPRRAELGFDLYIGNRFGEFVTPPTLDPFGPLNQQFRMDIMDPAAPLDDLGAGVLATVYETRPGDETESGYDRITYDMSPFAGETVRLRFAMVDNAFFFQAGIDNVTLGRGAVGGGGVVHSATGSGHTEGASGARRTFTFSAVERADGSVSGQFNLVLHESVRGSTNPATTRIQAEVVCISVSGSQAWVGGVVKSSSNPDWVGLETGWSVLDDGEGSSSSDRISLMNVPNVPGTAQATCDDRTRVPDLIVERGNVQVR
jgi:hypothetical protein